MKFHARAWDLFDKLRRWSTDIFKRGDLVGGKGPEKNLRGFYTKETGFGVAFQTK